MDGEGSKVNIYNTQWWNNWEQTSLMCLLWIMWKLKPLVPMYLQTLRQWTKMLSLTVSLGHGQPSLCLFCTQLIKAKLVLHIPEQQFAWTARRPFFHSLAFSGKIHHENKADDKENSNTNLENTEKISCFALSSHPFSDPLAWDKQECVASAEQQEHPCQQTALLGPHQALGSLPFSFYGRLSSVCPIKSSVSWVMGGQEG